MKIGDTRMDIETEDVYVMIQRLPISWVKVLQKQGDPDIVVQIFPPSKIREFRKVE